MYGPATNLPFGLDQMAGFLETEQKWNFAGEPKYSRSEYRDSLQEMLQKGWLAVQANPLPDRQRLRDEGLQCPSRLIPEKGSIVLAEEGEKLYRKVLLALEGPDGLHDRDTIRCIDRGRQEFRLYSPVKRRCQKEASYYPLGLQRQFFPELAYHVEIVEIIGPEKCGPWRSSRFHAPRRGYCLTIRYRPIRRSKFQIPSLGMDAMLVAHHPVYIRGTLGGALFYLGDFRVFIGQRRTKWFRWTFKVYGPPDRFDKASSTSRGCGFTTAFLHEEVEHSRTNPLSVREMKKIAITCAEKYRAAELLVRTNDR